MWKSFLEHIFTKKCISSRKTTTITTPPATIPWYTFRPMQCSSEKAYFSWQCSSGTMAVCLARDSLCAVNHDRPPGRLYARRYSADSCGCLCSRRSSKSSNRTATGRRCFAVNGPTVWSNLGGSGVSDSSLVGFKHTLKTHLFTVEQYVAAVNWCCCDFTAIVAPDTIDFTYLLTRGKRKHGEPHIV